MSKDLRNYLTAPSRFLPVLSMVAVMLYSVTAQGWGACLYLFLHSYLSTHNSFHSKVLKHFTNNLQNPLLNQVTKPSNGWAYWRAKVLCVTEQISWTEQTRQSKLGTLTPPPPLAQFAKPHAHPSVLFILPSPLPSILPISWVKCFCQHNSLTIRTNGNEYLTSLFKTKHKPFAFFYFFNPTEMIT